MHDTLRAIATTLRSYATSGGNLVVDDQRGMLDPTRFQILGSAEERKITFIDGGQAELACAPTFLLQFVRVAVLPYEHGKRDIQRHEYYTLTTLHERDGKMVYETQTFPEMIVLPDIAQDDPSLSVGGHAVTIQQVGSVVRKLLELDILERALQPALAGDIIIRDGDLLAHATCENAYWQRIYEHTSRGVFIAGLSKTTNAFTTSGSAATQALTLAGPREPWYYPHHTRGLVDVGFVRLHPRSEHVFRLDTLRGATTIASLLATHASDPIFLGYPYGLIQADTFARVSNKEREYLTITFMHAAQDTYPALLTHMRSLDAHSILDSIG